MQAHVNLVENAPLGDPAYEIERSQTLATAYEVEPDRY